LSTRSDAVGSFEDDDHRVIEVICAECGEKFTHRGSGQPKRCILHRRRNKNGQSIHEGEEKFGGSKKAVDVPLEKSPDKLMKMLLDAKHHAAETGEPLRHPLNKRQKQILLLVELRKRASVVMACDEVGITDRYYRKWRLNSERFRKESDEAIAYAHEILKTEAWRRAVDGIDEPVGFYKGKSETTIKRYDSKLLIELLRATWPKEFGIQQHEHRGVFASLDLSKCTDDQLARLAAGENPLTVLGQNLPQELMQQLPPGRDLTDLDEEG